MSALAASEGSCSDDERTDERVVQESVRVKHRQRRGARRAQAQGSSSEFASTKKSSGGLQAAGDESDDEFSTEHSVLSQLNVKPSQSQAATANLTQIRLKKKERIRNRNLERSEKLGGMNDQDHGQSYVAAMIPRMESELGRLDLASRSPAVPGPSRYQSLPVVDACEESSGERRDQVSPVPSCDRSTSPPPVSDRQQLFSDLSALIGAATRLKEREPVDQKLTMRGRRMSRVGFGEDPKHQFGDILWLHLQTYLHGLNMDKAQIKHSTELIDHVLQNAYRTLGYNALSAIQHFQLSALDHDQSTVPDALTLHTPNADANRSSSTLEPHDLVVCASECVRLSVGYMDEHMNARLRVAQVLAQYEVLYGLYPNTNTMRKSIQRMVLDDCAVESTEESAECSSEQQPITFGCVNLRLIEQRVKVLYVWLNLAQDLSDRLREVGNLLDVSGRELNWPFLNCYQIEDPSLDANQTVNDNAELALNKVIPSSASFASDYAREQTSGGRASFPWPSSGSVSVLSGSGTVTAGDLALDKEQQQALADMYYEFVQKSLRNHGMLKVLHLLYRKTQHTLKKARAALHHGPELPSKDANCTADSSLHCPSELGTRHTLPQTPGPGSELLYKDLPLTPHLQQVCNSAHDSTHPSIVVSDASTSMTKTPSSSNQSKSTDPTNARIHKTLNQNKHVKSLLCDELEFGEQNSEFGVMGLPSLRPLFLFLLRVQLDLVHQWLRVRVNETLTDNAQHSEALVQPDPQCLETLMQDSHDCLEAAVDMKAYYIDCVQVAAPETESELKILLLDDLRPFEEHLSRMFGVYLNYLSLWVRNQAEVLNTPVEWWQTLATRLEQQWRFAKRIAISVVGGEQNAAKTFCTFSGNIMFNQMVTEHMQSECERIVHGEDVSDAESTDGPYSAQSGVDTDAEGCNNDKSAQSAHKTSTVLSMCSEARRLIKDTRERANRALAFARLLMNDLEICAEFKFSADCDTKKLMLRLHQMHFVMVCIPHMSAVEQEYLMFCEQSVAANADHLQLLLNVTCGRDEKEVPQHLADKKGYLLLVKCDRRDALLWPGERCQINPDPDTQMSLQYMQVNGVYLVVVHAKLLGDEREAMRRKISDQFIVLIEDQCSCHELIAQEMDTLKNEAMKLRSALMSTIKDMCDDLLYGKQLEDLAGVERTSYRNTLMQAYNFAFDYHRELTRFVSSGTRRCMAVHLKDLAELFKHFVVSKYARGHKTFPRWATPSLNFLLMVARPEYTTQLTDQEFVALKETMTKCIDHIVGGDTIHCLPVPVRTLTLPCTTSSSSLTTPTAAVVDKTQHSSTSSTSTGTHLPVTPNSPVHTDIQGEDSCAEPALRDRRSSIRECCAQTDNERHSRLQHDRRVGRQVDNTHGSAVNSLHGRKAPFRWRRLEKKIGEGKFGKVYRALNLDQTPHKLIAMKQINIKQRVSDADILALKDEYSNLNNVRHENLVAYYGIEVHYDELLIFMELCEEGTLEQVCLNGIDNEWVRRYTHYLLKAVQHLHNANIIHRDIKPANIFMCSAFPWLKLGDFGCSVRLTDVGTVFGQVTDMTGTFCYMAPEVCRSGKQGNEVVGYGRAADIWSVGCVVLEMLTGKSPWPSSTSWGGILFTVGSGQHPPIPNSLPSLDTDFLLRTFVADGEQRATAEALLMDPFCRVIPQNSESDVNGHGLERARAATTR